MGVKTITKANLKKVFIGYRTLDRKTERSLFELGFTVSSSGKHNKLYLDGKLIIAFPKTGSDGFHAGNNLVSSIWVRLPSELKQQ